MVNLSESSKHPELFMEFFKERVSHWVTFDVLGEPTESDEPELIQKVFENFGPCMQTIKVSTLL